MSGGRRVEGLAEIVLWVRDMDASLRFYRDRLGLVIISLPAMPNKFLRASDPGGVVPEMIVLVPQAAGAEEFPREKARRVLHHLAFRMSSDGYDALKAELEAAGVEVRGGVHPVLKGVRTFYVDDPDGNECEVICWDPGHPDSTKIGWEPSIEPGG